LLLSLTYPHFLLLIPHLINLHIQSIPLLRLQLPRPLLTSLIIPPLHHIPPIIPLPLAIQQIFIFALGLEIGFIDIEVTAIVGVLDAGVGQSGLGGAYQVVEVLDAELALAVEEFVGFVGLGSGGKVEGAGVVLACEVGLGGFEK
jgi:hypothetical protein